MLSRDRVVWLTGLVMTVALALPGVWAQEQAQEGLAEPPPQPAAARIAPPSTRRPLIQVCLILDTSSGMAALVDQAKIEAWSIANELLLADKAGRPPIVELGVVEYGSIAVPAARGYTRVVTPLTTDIDSVAMGLGYVKTGGGNEYCGWAIREAVQRLEWSPYPEDVRIIFIAGDKSFTQGPVDYPSSCQSAAAKMIVVNTVYCGPHSTGVHYGWAGAAQSTGGQYISISINKPPRYRPTPVDSSLLDLNRRLNETYRLMTDPSRDLFKRQQEQDRNIWMLSREAVLQRIVTKGAEAMGQDALPNEGQQTASEVTQSAGTAKGLDQIKEQAALRRQIQEEILDLGCQRRLYLMSNEPASSQQGHTLGTAVIQVLREQIVKKGYTIQRPTSQM